MKLPIRAIHTPQELHLLHRITKSCGKPEQILEFLQDSHLGPESAVAKGEWQLWRSKLKLMAEALQWQDLFKTTGALLKQARTKDQIGHLPESRLSDWIVWDAFISSAIHLENHE
jgi:N-terminal acetyltransferase B complex non-catalytic subunit